MRQNPQALEVYRHFKGKCYQVIDIAKHTETGEELVIYRPLYDSQGVYARPLTMFLSEVDREKYPEVKQQYRFEKVDFNQSGLFAAESSTQTDGGRSTDVPKKREQKEYSVMDFLDADTYEAKLEVLTMLRNKLDASMLNTIAASLDLETKDGSIEDQYEDIRYCLMTLEKYECNRLR